MADLEQNSLTSLYSSRGRPRTKLIGQSV